MTMNKNDEKDEDYANEDYEYEDEQTADSGNPVHPNLFPWLRKELRVTIYDKSILRFLEEENYFNEYQLDENPENLGGAEQEELLRIVRRQQKRLVSHMSEEQSKGASRPDSRTRPYRQSLDVTAHQEAERRRRAIADLLTPKERECANQVTVYLATLLAGMPSVRDFRTKFLDKGMLNEQQCDDFIRSPASRFLTGDDFERLGLSASNCGASVISWRIGFVETQNAYERTGHQDTVFDRVDPRQEIQKFYTTRLKIDPEKRARKRLIGVDEESLLWIPFLPLDTFQDRQDETFPRMFPTSVADELAGIAESLSHAFPWQVWELCLFILTGKIAQLSPVRVTSMPTSLAAAKQSKVDHEHGFLTRLVFGKPFRGSISINAEPWISAESIRNVYLSCQQEVNIEREIKASADGKKAARPAQHWLPQGRLIEYVMEGVMSSNDDQRHWGWENLRKNYVKRSTPEKIEFVHDASGFRKAYQRACRVLDLPWDIRKVIGEIKTYLR